MSYSSNFGFSLYIFFTIVTRIDSLIVIDSLLIVLILKKYLASFTKF